MNDLAHDSQLCVLSFLSNLDALHLACTCARLAFLAAEHTAWQYYHSSTLLDAVDSTEVPQFYRSLTAQGYYFENDVLAAIEYVRLSVLCRESQQDASSSSPRCTVAVGRQACLGVYRAYMSLRRDCGVHPLCNTILPNFTTEVQSSLRNTNAQFRFCSSSVVYSDEQLHTRFEVHQHTVVPRVLSFWPWSEPIPYHDATCYSTALQPTLQPHFALGKDSLNNDGHQKSVRCLKSLLHSGSISDLVVDVTVVDDAWWDLVLAAVTPFVKRGTRVVVLVDLCKIMNDRFWLRKFAARLDVLSSVSNYTLIDVNPDQVTKVLNFNSRMMSADEMTLVWLNCISRDMNENEDVTKLQLLRPAIRSLFQFDVDVKVPGVAVQNDVVGYFDYLISNRAHDIDTVAGAFLYACFTCQEAELFSHRFHEVLCAPLFPVSPLLTFLEYEKVQEILINAQLDGSLSSVLCPPDLIEGEQGTSGLTLVALDITQSGRLAWYSHTNSRMCRWVTCHKLGRFFQRRSYLTRTRMKMPCYAAGYIHHYAGQCFRFWTVKFAVNCKATLDELEANEYISCASLLFSMSDANGNEIWDFEGFANLFHEDEFARSASF